MLLTMSVSMISCSDKDDEPSAVVGKVLIQNKSSYTLASFKVNFTNDKGEVITQEDKGTLKAGDAVKVDVPIGASYYYMSTIAGSQRFFSPDYSVSVRMQVLTDQIVGNWRANQ